jgi:hypothetical protein
MPRAEWAIQNKPQTAGWRLTKLPSIVAADSRRYFFIPFITNRDFLYGVYHCT